MKILFIIPGEEEGNSMIFAKRQIKFLASNGIIASSFFLKSRSDFFILLKEYRRFRKLFNLFQPDLVHCHYGTMTAFFAAVSHSKPLVITYHGSDLNFLKNENRIKEFISKLLSQLAALRASIIVCVSEKLKQKLWWNKKIVSVLPMGVDEDFFKPLDVSECRRKLKISPDEKIILFNYNNAAVKRPDIANATLEILKSKISNSKLWILNGESSPENMLQLLNASDCLLLCSDSEGSPTIVKEAMACNLPVVSSDVGDVRRNIEQTIPYAVTAQDPLQLAKGIEDVLTMNKRSSGRDVLIKLGLTEQSISLNLLNLYKKILKK